jgi:acyl transferase domain-containing protein/acyl carrier protein
MTVDNSAEDLSYYEVSLAIVGMAGRFPDAQNPLQFWQNIINDVKSIRQFSNEDLLAAGVSSSLIESPTYVKAGTVITEVGFFDSAFFGFSGREAESMDPQTRLLLECAWEGLEDAAYDPQRYNGRIGVFVGKHPSDYKLSNLYANPAFWADVNEMQLASGNDADALASMVAYKMGLTGPSISVQTFCSTSLVAVHLACQSLLTYESDMAIAGGVSLEIPHGTGYLYEEGGILSPDGECRPFDAEARGTVIGNGAGIVVLKRLEDALEDGDHIYAVVRGSATNNDGLKRVSYAAPGLNGQAAVMASALGNAGIEPDMIDYVETHGIGTPMGDAIELAAMIKVFKQGTKKRQFCALGSLKPNVGHLDRASGVAGLIKTALALQNKQLPAMLNFERPQGDIDLDNSPFYVNTVSKPWPLSGSRRRAGVSSFGIGGSNAYVVMEESPEKLPSSDSRPYQLLLLSAKTAGALESVTTNLVNYLRQNRSVNLADVAFSLQIGRAEFNHRRFVVCHQLSEAVEKLAAADPNYVWTKQQTNREDRSVCFLFSDAGAYSKGMGHGLYKTEVIFRECVDHCQALLMPYLESDLTELLYRSGRTVLEGKQQTIFEHVAVFVTEYALAQLLISWGITPQTAIGVGVGEYTMACLADVMSLTDALQLVTQRASLLHEASSTPLTPSLTQVQTFIDLTGDMLFHAPQIAYISSVTNNTVDAEMVSSPDYWVKHLCQTQGNTSGLDRLLSAPNHILLQLGDNKQLGDLVRQQPSYIAELEPLILTAMYEGGDDMTNHRCLTTMLGQLWLLGITINWTQFYAYEQRHRIPLPTYPFQRQRYWVDAQTAKPISRSAAAKKEDISDWFYLPTWQQTLLPKQLEPTSSDNPQKTSHLLFMDDLGLSEALAQQLQHAGHSVIGVRAGSQFSQEAENQYTINPRREEDYQQLLQSLKTLPMQIIHAWSITAAQLNSTQSPVEKFTQAQYSGFYSLLYLVKALKRNTDALTIWAITNQAQPVTGTEPLYPEKTTILGACRVIPQENLNITCGYIDIDWLPDTAWQTERLASQLVTELARPLKDPVIAYRGNNRWVQSFSPLRLTENHTIIQPQGVYWIIGGLGNVGLTLARYLAQSFQARLVLTSRTPLPESVTWSEWLNSHPSTNTTSLKISALLELESLGAEILLLPADATDETQMAKALVEIEARFDSLDGVIYAVGTPDDSYLNPMQELTVEQCQAQFAPKVHGLYVLDKVLANRPLDFCLLFSSLASVLGGLSLGGYTAAHLFMDTYTHWHNRYRRQWWTCVNWDIWRTGPEQTQKGGSTIATYEILPTEAVQSFNHIIATLPQTHIINSTGSLLTRLEQWGNIQEVKEAVSLYQRPELATVYAPATNEIEEDIIVIWQSVLGISPIGIDDSFFELGGHSLSATQIVTRLRQRFQTHLPLSLVLTSPTIAELAVDVELAIISELEDWVDDAGVNLNETKVGSSGF